MIKRINVFTVINGLEELCVINNIDYTLFKIKLLEELKTEVYIPEDDNDILNTDEKKELHSYYQINKFIIKGKFIESYLIYITKKIFSSLSS